MSTAKNLIQSIKEETKSARSKISDTYLELVELFPLKPIESEKDHKLLHAPGWRGPAGRATAAPV